MRKCGFILLGMTIAGCVANNSLQYDAVAQANVYRIARVRKGMSEKEVLQIMHKPYSYESFEADEDVYDVWFYVTRPTGLDQTRMVPQNLTPLTFKNGVLVGTGYSWYYFAMREKASAAPTPEAEKPKSQEEEDREFEKELRAPVPNNVPAQSSPVSQLVSVSEKSFTKVRTGMTKEEVMDLIGSPGDEENLSVGDDVYDVWFYQVNPKDSKKAPKRVPLTFKNDVLVGTTQKTYNAVRKKAGVERVGEYDQEDDRFQEGEAEQNFDYW